MSPSPDAQNPVCVRHNAESHPLPTFLSSERAYFQLSSHKQLGALLDIDDTFRQFAKTADGEVVCLPTPIPHRQPEVAVLFATFSSLLDLPVVGGIADKCGFYALIIQKSSPPLG